MPFDYFPFSKNHNCYFKPPGIFCKIENHNNIIFNREKSGKSLVIISLFRPISASYFHEFSLSLIFSSGLFSEKSSIFPQFLILSAPCGGVFSLEPRVRPISDEYFNFTAYAILLYSSASSRMMRQI